MVLLLQCVWVLICVAIYLAIPTSLWCLMGLETFWQRPLSVALTGAYLVGAGLIGFWPWLWIASEIDCLLRRNQKL